MKQEFTSKQREIIARKLGYDGPMQSFDEFLNSSPALQAKYNAVSDKYVQRMAKGGAVKKYQVGGAVTDTTNTGVTFNEQGVPMAPSAATVTPEMVKETPDQIVTAPAAAEKVSTVEAERIEDKDIATVDTPTKLAANLVTTTTAAPKVQEELDKTKAVTGTVSDQALVTAEQGQVSDASLATAVKGTATQVVAPEERRVQEGEMIEGSTVDQARVDDILRQTRESAEQGVVTEEMTTQGQLDRLLAGFEAGNPPVWAAASMRAATATLAARGLGASSLAGQAVIQAAMESAVPIASADAQVYQEMEMQNLSNRQQVAVLAAQQRAEFLGQEFDQSFRARVENAAKISEIANMNFTASQQIALENARLAQQMDLANLNNEQAVILANAATQATMDLQNLSNRQQAAVANAKAFLDIDIQNLSNEQQTALFKAKTITDALLSDAAAENASKQFNASSQNQTDQFMANLTATVAQFNAAQRNSTNQFNVDQVNAVNRFNTDQQNQREQFNANHRLIIDQANAAWRREISTANTAAINTANYVNAQNLNAMTIAEYNNQTQLYRDQVDMAWKSYENNQERITNLAAAEITGKSAKDAAAIKGKSDMWSTVGTFATKVAGDKLSEFLFGK
jgi:hypothetical protein